jgi:hypothetical protein
MGGFSVSIPRARIVTLAGSIAIFFLLNASPAIAATTAVAHHPSTILLTHVRAASGEDLNVDFPAYVGETVIGGLILSLGWFVGDARRKRIDLERGRNRELDAEERRRVEELRSALVDFDQRSKAMQRDQAKGFKTSEQAWRELHSAQARVEAVADSLSDIQNEKVLKKAEDAKAETSRALKRLENPEGGELDQVAAG